MKTKDENPKAEEDPTGKEGKDDDDPKTDTKLKKILCKIFRMKDKVSHEVFVTIGESFLTQGHLNKEYLFSCHLFELVHRFTLSFRWP